MQHAVPAAAPGAHLLDAGHVAEDHEEEDGRGVDEVLPGMIGVPAEGDPGEKTKAVAQSGKVGAPEEQQEYADVQRINRMKELISKPFGVR